jgi:glycosyltransferase involved in cell wall biosynthesis
MSQLHTKRKYYISAEKGESGITQYSRDFYQLVLKERDYIFIDSADSLPDILSKVASVDHVHIELGIFQEKELEILFTMLRANYKSVAVTLHDAPLVKYPFHRFKNRVLNNLSKLYDIYGNSAGAVIPYLKKLKAIYVLSKKGQEAVKKRYKINHVYYLPHVIDTQALEPAGEPNHNFLYFGFIGRNKGIEYALQLHQHLLSVKPDIHFYVAGTALGKEEAFLTYLKKKYQTNVNYLGYVPDDQLRDVFKKATYSLLLFRDYKFYWPISGSILQSMHKGKVLLTNNVNAVSEIIEESRNGFFLTGDLKKDAEKIIRLINEPYLLKQVQLEGYKYLIEHHSPDVVKMNLKD